MTLSAAPTGALWRLFPQGSPAGPVARARRRPGFVNVLLASLVLVAGGFGRAMAYETPPEAERTFRHPGVLLTAANLEEIRCGVRDGREPWKSWFAPYDHDPGTFGHEGRFEEYGRNADVNREEFQSDMWQLYRMAVLWVVKKDRRAAERGVGILENYAKNHKRFVGVEATFMQGDCMNAIVAAEILRSTYPGWTERNTANIKRYFSDVWWSTIRVGKDNTGAGSHLWTANQGTIGLKVAMAIAIFCDDPVRFNMCLNAYTSDPLTGLADSLPNGEVGDCGRDSGHWTAECVDSGLICQMAWAQGVDLFASYGNRIVAISEFLARNELFMQGVVKQNAPFTPFGCSYAFFTQVAPFDNVRGIEFMDVVATYARRKGVPAPFTRKLVEREGYKPVFTLDDSIPAAPIAPFWMQPPLAPVANLQSKTIGSGRGTTNVSGGVWNLAGDSGKMEDGCRFAYREADGDWVFMARVVDHGAIMMTDRLAPAGQCSAVWFEVKEDGTTVLWKNGQHSYQMPWDLKYFDSPRAPMWFKLVRRGVMVSAWQSVDGVSWSPSANVRFAALPDKVFVGLGVCRASGKFDHVAFGSEPSSLPAAPTDVQAVARSDRALVRWRPGANTVFCDVLRAETPGGPYTPVGERVTASQFLDEIERGKTYYYVISPAGYSGRGPNSPEVSARGI